MSLAVQLRNANQMVLQAAASEDGLDVAFADGARGTVPWPSIPEIGALEDLMGIDLPNAYELILTSQAGDTVELPWDFLRSFCDPSYRQRSEASAERGRRSLGQRIRQLRKETKMSQEDLASSAGIGRVTLVRIEKGEQSPRYETLLALATALGRQPAELITP